MIDKKMAQKLAELGNVAPVVSVEGFEKETDERRGKGVWRKAMQAMDNSRPVFSIYPFRKESSIQKVFLHLYLSVYNLLGDIFKKPNI